MAYYSRSNTQETQEGLAWDLRQRRVDLLSNILFLAEEARQQHNLTEWLNYLDGLIIHVTPKLKEEEEIKLNELLATVSDTIKKKPGAIKTQNGKEDLYQKLKTLHIYILKMMEKYDMFGSAVKVMGL